MIARETILELATQLPSYAAVARTVGLSRERVRQICEKHGVKPVRKGYMAIEEAAVHFGYVPNSEAFRNRVKDGLLPYYYHKNRLFVRVDQHELAPCLTCGKPIGKGRFSYCSEECLHVADKKAHARCGWRRYYRRIGQKIDTSSVDFKDRHKQRVVPKKTTTKSRSNRELCVAKSNSL